MSREERKDARCGRLLGVVSELRVSKMMRISDVVFRDINNAEDGYDLL